MNQFLSVLSIIFLALTLVQTSACESKGGGESTVATGPPLFESVNPESSGLQFTNTVENDEDFNIFKYRNFYNGGGVGLGDLNNNGLIDVFLTANMGANKLFLNEGNMQFKDISATAGIELSNKWSTGVAMIDINADGWLDVYVCNAGFQKGSDQKNSLFINNQDGTFTEAAAEYGLDDSGYTTHAAFVDYDRDGDLDVYLLNNSFIPVNTLNYSNNRELPAKDWKVRNFLKGGGDKLMRNDGGQFIDVTESAGIYGSLIGFGLGITVGDINADGYPDLYVSNDFYERDYLYINQQDGTFSEEIEQWMPHLSLASMGADMADINNDGLPEVFATEMLPESDYRRKTTVQFEDLNVFALKQRRGFYKQFMHNTLQLNNGDGTFSEIAQYAGVEATDWSWGALLFDADNDGLRDIYVCNGIYHNLTNQDFIDFFANDVVQKMAATGKKDAVAEVIAKMPSEALPNKFFRNQGDLTFADATQVWTPDMPSFSNGAAYGDLDNDGDLDLVVNNVNQPAYLLRNTNDPDAGQTLTIRLKGEKDNPFALGARIELRRGDQVQSQEVIPTRGFQSSVPYAAVFSLSAGSGGVALSPDPSPRERGDGSDGSGAVESSLVVYWPDGLVTTIKDYATLVKSDVLLIDYAAWKAKSVASNAADQSFASDNTKVLFEPKDLGLAKHEEDNYLDLLNEGLVIRSLTNEGPESISGDFNGDGLEDLFVGGARYQTAQLYFQKNGKLVAQDQQIFKQASASEDTGLAVFDADGDGDLDIFAGSGGNFESGSSPFYGDKLYFNDGKGQFSFQPKSLPPYAYNTSVGVPFDYDDDGDMDLFLGTRSKPLDYGASAISFLLENDGNGKFTDVTRTKAPIFASLDLVTDAATLTLPSNLPGTGDRALVVVSEWGTPRIFSYDGTKFTERETELENYAGWWNSVTPADLNGDGHTDLVLGNVGENFYFSVSPEAPAKLWVADFDNNGKNERIITQTIDGRDMPVAMKRNLTAALPGLKKVSLKHEEYATKTIQQLFPDKTLAKAKVLTANYFKTVVAINDGAGNYKITALPKEVQLSCVCDAYCTDLTGDGTNDLVLGGNFSGLLPQFSSLDGSYGHTLINDGNGNFDYVPNRESGLLIRGEVRDFTRIILGGKPHLVATVNDATPVCYALTTAERVAQ